jgi:hypothetical protein
MSSVMCKLLDHILLDIHSQVFVTSELQFGFKADHSTVMCNFVLQETVQYYLSKESKVHCLSLDATKAFDRVNYLKLFDLLVKRGTCPLTVRFLLKMYKLQKIRVRWDDDLSNECTISNGVKQGGVLSPILFTVYLDEMMLRLKVRDCGCHIGGVFAGAIAYADDVCLLSPSLQGLREMLLVVESFALSYYVQFNPEKSVLLLFNDQNGIPIAIDFMGQKVRTDSDACVKHLGLFIGRGALQKNIQSAVGDLYARTNCLNVQFKHVGWRVRLLLFFSFCYHLYGCETWDLSSSSVNSFYVAFRKCIRSVIRLPYRTHRRLLPLIYNRKSVDICVMNRISKFVSKLGVSKNRLVKACATAMICASGSSLSNSVSIICSRFFIERDDLFDCCHIFGEETEPDDETTSNAVVELLDCRDNIETLAGFQMADIKAMLSLLCEQ